MEQRHGGDIYRNQVNMDFSVNTNPLGMPDSVRDALQGAIRHATEYPDQKASALYLAVEERLCVPKEWLCFGNGASELFLAIVHALRPKKILLPVPSFYGYEHAAEAAESEIVRYCLKAENDFRLQEDFLDQLTEDIDLIFLANPNNPTGRCVDKTLGLQLLQRCREKQITVVLDECFIEFAGEEKSFYPYLKEFDHLVIVCAFTKTYAIPGVRLGYLLCSNSKLCGKIQMQLPEWNLSTFAQAAGIAAAGEETYVRESAAYVRDERIRLTSELRKMEIQVFDSEANYILIYSDVPLYDRLLGKKILIRDCSNFAGVGSGYYRVAVRTREENDKLVKAIGECIEAD